jgi:hypothetical protein
MQTGEMVCPDLRPIQLFISESLETAEDSLSIMPSAIVVILANSNSLTKV